MCGIIAYKGPKNGVEIVLNGLKKLEYRGYDSWGIAVNGKSIQVVKKVGRIGSVSLNDLGLKPSHIAMGHTRWATHGGVTEANAHPHLSNDGKIAVVHNGIVENYQELRDFLIKNGFKFKSQTDTEVIPNFIQYCMRSMDFEEAVRCALLKLEGSFAVVVMHESTLVGARRNSPLVAGINCDEIFLASDVPAFLEYTNKVIYIEDGEMVVSNKGIEFSEIKTGKIVKKQPMEIKWTVEQAMKGNYPHFMLKEINEQGITIKKAVEQDSMLLERATKKLKSAQGIFFVACGTSYHACVSAGYEFAEIAKRHVNLVVASEFRNYADFITDKTLVIAFSQSGETADVLDAVSAAKEKGAEVIAITNVMGSSLMRAASETIMMNSGPEICVLSTKTYTAQLAILLLLAYSVAGRLEEGKKLIAKAASHVTSVINENESVLKDISSRFKNSHDLFLIGRDLAYPSALEGALKIKEVSYIHAEGFAGAELKHGTIALIEKNVPVIVLVTEKTKRLILGNAAEIKLRGGCIIGINEKNNELYDYFVRVPGLGDADPIIMIIPMQMLAYHLALARGCDPDKPRNLAKSVTVK